MAILFLKRNNGIFFTSAIYCIILFYYTKPSNGYCWQIGWNPSFKAAPKITQKTTTSVQVSWANIVEAIECADEFLVKYWRSSNPSKYVLTDLDYRMNISSSILCIPV